LKTDKVGIQFNLLPTRTSNTLGSSLKRTNPVLTVLDSGVPLGIGVTVGVGEVLGEGVGVLVGIGVDTYPPPPPPPPPPPLITVAVGVAMGVGVAVGMAVAVGVVVGVTEVVAVGVAVGVGVTVLTVIVIGWAEVSTLTSESLSKTNVEGLKLIWAGLPVVEIAFMVSTASVPEPVLGASGDAIKVIEASSP